MVFDEDGKFRGWGKIKGGRIYVMPMANDTIRVTTKV